MNIIERTKSFLKEVYVELKRVNWPSRQETIRLTVIVIFVSLFIAVFLGVVDILFRIILTKILA